MSRRTAFASAKVNLYLHVGPTGDDGYHPIDSLMVFANVGDVLSCEPAPAWRFEGDGPFAHAAPMDDSNLVVRAARAVARASNADGALHMRLEKTLPVAAGIGGGSADAAATLRLVNSVFGALDAVELRALAEDLGSDVPACLVGAPSVARGRGERLSPAPDLPILHAVLVNPLVAALTGPVFAAYDRQPPPAEPLGPALPDSFDSVEALADWLRSETRNDLEAPSRSLTPAAGEAIDLLAASPLSLLSRMSGSGATAFALCAGPEEAQALAGDIEAQRPNWWVRACRLGAGA